jgi:polar amino acid transport system substrate-binding protein|tara:strand:+ start:16369 stop:17280 length:912 start_codon:yes stop_codon:yes gene_type:complete
MIGLAKPGIHCLPGHLLSRTINCGTKISPTSWPCVPPKQGKWFQSNHTVKKTITGYRSFTMSSIFPCVKKLLFATAALLSAQTASAETIKLATLEWPPYTGAKLPEGGQSTIEVKKLFAGAGFDLDYVVLPWNRAIDTGTTDPAFAGYYPEYYDASRDAEKNASGNCLFSNSFGKSPVGFIQNVATPITWSSHEDLEKYTIGVVSGYVNETTFDAMVAAGKIKVDAVVSDVQNIKKVAAGRVNAAVIDKNVLTYSLSSDPALKNIADKISFNEKLLADNDLYVCFQNNDKGKAMRAAFNAQIK